MTSSQSSPGPSNNVTVPPDSRTAFSLQSRRPFTGPFSRGSRRPTDDRAIRGIMSHVTCTVDPSLATVAHAPSPEREMVLAYLSLYGVL